MSSIFKRLYNMARVEGAYRLKKFGDMLFGDIEKKARNFESQWSEDSRTHWKSSDGFSGGTSGGASGAGNGKPGYSAGGVPKQVAEDLATFNLRPPCTWKKSKRRATGKLKNTIPTVSSTTRKSTRPPRKSCRSTTPPSTA